ncbi:hypothetical protein DICPUDRAFT_158112 [Dictyostelium purpureum]|uniref:AB hydrolase-1 domain-containing protein n=1 Tax=Dictyostelium purpureum TaxID=5786 RepID=F1A0V6_DICPU|nr:uncharacterized protein DICPUDRAFT_158112 [Dictyostelium purpureum]EGC30177.1 hypothetical protein DICPUDRAFT_158112 [Dictyostelium purpureum]|eukprot:XP_003293303.1 hypothetical protein DICPUDRAFT_158112 [Dictyostelium purpureum]
MNKKFFVAGKNRNNQLKLEYEVLGEGKEKIIFLPGILSTSCTWKNQINYITKQYPQYQVASFHYRGIGNSDFHQAAKGMRDHSLDLLDFIEHLNWDKVHLVGNSFGSQVAFDFAVHSKSRIKSLLLSSMKPPHKNYILEVSLILDSIYKNDLESFQSLFFSQDFLNSKSSDGSTIKDKLQGPLLKQLKERYLMPREVLNDQFKSTFNYLLTNEDVIKVKNRDFPISIVYGSNDAIYPYRDTLKLLDIIKPDSFSIFNGCGHGVPNERFNDFNKELIKTLNLKRSPNEL